MYHEYSSYCLDEEMAPQNKGHWRKNQFGMGSEAFLDLEIGTGNGYHFAHRAQCFPERQLLGIELKYKPLIQTIRRAVRSGCLNAKVMRYNAVHVDQIFAPEEIHDVFIHFPDPWVKTSQKKHRLVQLDFLLRLHQVQKKGSRVEFKTDNKDYFLDAMEQIQKSPYHIVGSTMDLHHSCWSKTNFITQFENLFLREGLPIHFALLEK
ncbi:MAG: tRNA (guanosine(46)-N7)-methyltransferase TrmB [Bdellovibrionales bacterium]|nr:tRNA (guanosine(46)-N7)-methyltransferase TrmB [Bdellovibrionales bacterium]